MLQVQSCFRSSHSHPPKTIVGQEHCMFLTQQNPCHVILGWPPSIEIQHELSGWGFWTLCWSKSFHVAGQHTTPWIVRDAHSNLALRVWKSSELRSKSTPGLASTSSATPFALLRLCLHLGFRLLPRQSFGLGLCFGDSGGLKFLRLRNKGPQKKQKLITSLV